MPIESMKITNVKATWLRVPIPEARQSVSDFGRNDSFNTTLVRVETDEGLVGYGEAKASVGSIGAQRALVAVIEGELAPLLVGEDPRDIARLWEVMYNRSRAGYALARGRVFPALGRRGITICAASGVDLNLDPISATDDQIVIPDRPGLGVSINQDFVERFKVE